MTPFGRAMHDLRARKGVTQAEMAKELGVSAAYLSALEHGNRGAPPFAIVLQVIQYFDLIWDEAEKLKELAAHSRPKVTLKTVGLKPSAIHLVNLLEEKLHRLDYRTVEALIEIIESSGEITPNSSNE